LPAGALWLEKGIDERGDRTPLGEYDDESQKGKHEDDREQPIPLPDLQKLPEFRDERLISHDTP
jgi:hypothetical protein